MSITPTRNRESIITCGLILTIMAALIILLSGCGAPQISQASEQITVTVIADGKSQKLQIPSGSSAEKALAVAAIKLGADDYLTPSGYTVLGNGDIIKVTRVTTKLETVQTPVPFTRQVVRTELLSEGVQRIIQPGESGLTEATIRTVFEDGIKIKEEILNPVELKAAVPEIIAIGAQSPFSPLQIPGKLAYIADGNAWIMQGSTINRQPVITTGDLDGRVFTISPDGNWLLYTRKSNKPLDEEINTLWVIDLNDDQAKPINLKVSNIVHYAGFVPYQSNTIAYSTVEPRAAAPGWQANNDLYFMRFSSSSSLSQAVEIIQANAGGIYGWWGTNYIWAPDGKTLASARPDGIGLVNYKGEEKSIEPLLNIVPYQTGSDWALIPGLAWGADSKNLYVVTHAPPPGLVSPEESPYFDLTALSNVNSTNAAIVEQAGMFAYPAVSSLRSNTIEKTYLVAYSQAIFPNQSEKSYRLVVMDRDGSNRRVLFPPEGSTGLDPQTPMWAPAPLGENEGDFIGLIYKGNLWLIDLASRTPYQVTGDGSISKIDWR
jgi:resuscitation-promoting factor RpfB